MCCWLRLPSLNVEIDTAEREPIAATSITKEFETKYHRETPLNEEVHDLNGCSFSHDVLHFVNGYDGRTSNEY